jgi:ferredoxin-NADP reductase/Na+-translocating ferredoxin:NAD+ oxidoreductase RnfD subunit
MLTRLDAALDRITMYRLVLYELLGLVGVAAALAAFGRMPFAPGALLLSAAFLVGLCWAANAVLARVFGVPTNVESACITGLILAVIVDPARTPGDLQVLGWAAVWAMASKYILSLDGRHIFNPAAVAAVIVGFALGAPASWWVGTGAMLPAVLLGGLLVVRKVRQEEMAASFLAAALATVCAVSFLARTPLAREVEQLLVASPVFFLASVMLTEPLTAPPTRDLRRFYGALVGILVVPQIHLGALYSTPELALVVGNAFSYLVGSRQRVALRLRRRTRLAPDMVDFAFTPSRRLTFAAGQYVEVTLGHAHPDARGNRRYFTLASSPTEETVRLGVRFYAKGSSFKRALAALDGRTRLMAGPVAGDFTLPADPARKLAFIAGGIGITPYRSMLKYLLDNRQRRDIVLLYAARTADDIAYRDVLGEAQTRLGVKILYTLTDAAAIPRAWTGERGRITAEMIREAAPDYAERLFYLSGPPAMVRAHERVLRAMGVRRDRIKKDLFAGLV